MAVRQLKGNWRIGTQVVWLYILLLCSCLVTSVSLQWSSFVAALLPSCGKYFAPTQEQSASVLCSSDATLLLPCRFAVFRHLLNIIMFLKLTKLQLHMCRAESGCDAGCRHSRSFLAVITIC